MPETNDTTNDPILEGLTDISRRYEDQRADLMRTYLEKQYDIERAYQDQLANFAAIRGEARRLVSHNIAVGACPNLADVNPGDVILLIAQIAAQENGVWVYHGAGQPLTRPEANHD